jgi:hypothetical protein
LPWLTCLAAACSPQPKAESATTERVATVAAEPAPATPAPPATADDAASPIAPTQAPAASSSVPTPARVRDAGAGAGASDVRPTKGVKGVKVVNIGMHVGGGPYDDVTKEPIARSVAPHFAELARCFPEGETKAVELGVDLVIEAAGGLAQVYRPRTPSKDAAFVACAMDVFRKIDFEKPRFGKTVVSYSLRFTPSRL